MWSTLKHLYDISQTTYSQSNSAFLLYYYSMLGSSYFLIYYLYYYLPSNSDNIFFRKIYLTSLTQLVLSECQNVICKFFWASIEYKQYMLGSILDKIHMLQGRRWGLELLHKRNRDKRERQKHRIALGGKFREFWICLPLFSAGLYTSLQWGREGSNRLH